MGLTLRGAECRLPTDATPPTPWLTTSKEHNAPVAAGTPLRSGRHGDSQKLMCTLCNYRVLFELEGKRIVVYALGPRKDIYQ
jgi:hypothetical protein